ncbi:serine proteinase stubble isoform X3 [Eurytemora carolleeae]|uniref:serine proteinase stubble isoform X3 n=1 Tax=Eurytemora carolleeae TaxID=1294199 RepID=UPI000C77A223|nr:serine proteinase stubble isoform X3 [Eurytemora carolleeae]|eukprot:XP_023337898.1 serine proteinase stubble-like isoform X3 [Eurytemora affinis]
MLKNIPPVVVQGLISLLCVSSSDPNPSIFLLTDPSSSNQKLTYSVPGVSSNRRRRDGFGFLQHSVSEDIDDFDDFFRSKENTFGDEYIPLASALVSEDDFRHGPSPSTWSNNERFFFTRPQQKRGRPSRPREKFFDNFAHPEVNWGEVRNDPRCGISAVRHSVAQRRIVGGDEAGFGTFPWQAYIRIGTSRCGGSLVNEWYVVTAGHCVARARPSQVRVTLGEYVLKSDAEPLPGRTYGASAIKVHPYFKFTPQADRFDVAVIRLNRRVDYAPHISPICLPPKNMPLLGHYGWASGWGALEPGSRLRPKTLQVVDVPMIDNRECEQWHREKGINVIIYDEMVCAGYYQGGKDSCQGDSGGPLMMEHEGRWTLIGLVSAGYSCAKRGQPGIYHRVAQTSDWISHSINS